MGIRSFSKMIYTLLSQIVLCRPSECYFFCGKHYVGRGSAVSDWREHYVGRQSATFDWSEYFVGRWSATSFAASIMSAVRMLFPIGASTLSADRVLLLLWQAL